MSKNDKTYRVYLAGAWPDRENMKMYQKKLRDMGCTVTHDWTVAEAVDWDSRTDEYNDRCAQLDLYHGVGTAHALVAIKTIKDYPYRGTEREIGFAQGRGIPVFILCPEDKDSYVCKNVFHRLTKGQTTFETWSELETNLKNRLMEFVINFF